MDNIAMILTAYGLDPSRHVTRAFGTGLIHTTILVEEQGEPAYILQRINHQVFLKPGDIAHNIRVMGNYLKDRHPDYLFTYPLQTTEGEEMFIFNGSYYRVFPFFKGTHSVDVCGSPDQAYEAARQFGSFTAVMDDLRIDMLRYTIPGFHDLILRYNQMLDAIRTGNRERVAATKDLLQFLVDRNGIVDVYAYIQKDPYFKKRVTHHDTKISNVLFNQEGKGVCVIDLDTVMPGHFISDVGDMMRTYLSPANEEETDMEQVQVRPEFYKAIIEGYRQQMGSQLSEKERSSFLYAGKFMIYMQAIRFYTDHLNNDVYYGARYEGHNLMRARNQAKLLEELEKREKELSRAVSS